MSDQAPSRSRSRGSSTRAAARKPAPETRAGAPPSRPRREDRRRRCLALGPRQSTGVDHPSLPILRSWSNLPPASSGPGFTAPWSSCMLSPSDRWFQGDHTSAPTRPIRTKLFEHRVRDRQRRADLIRDRLSGLPLGQVGVWLILSEGAWSQGAR
jgi:hypothetical protein